MSITSSRLLRSMLSGAALACIAFPAAAQTTAPSGLAHPARWPAAPVSVRPNPAIEARIAKLLAAMSLEQKVGQIIQADIGSATPQDVWEYHLGSVLNGGNSDPGGKYNASAQEWLALADAYYVAAAKPHGKLPRIPLIWGSDAVHGHNNVVGATLFPHNIGLGAMRDPALMRRIGAATALEMRVTGLDWTFAPTIAVVRDDRWGRTYEGFGESPTIAADYAAPLVEGLQGRVGSKNWLTGPHIVATAKHFIGDGGTSGGTDQGDARMSEKRLSDLFAAPYVAAIGAGVQSVMASFSSWNGVKMTGNRSMLTGVLKQRWHLDGFIVGDWNAHGQVPGCTTAHCPQAITAGLDMFMAPDQWKGLYASTLADVREGRLPVARLDDAVRRVLRVKFRAGLFETGKPSTRAYAGRFELLGSPEHRAIARQAVRESLVLLKNSNGLLPLKAGARILVAGDGADNITKQTGGWSLTWQGTGTTRADFPNGQTIWEGIAEATKAAGGSADLAVDGAFTVRPDVAIVVFGENPYAEFQGDRSDVAFDDNADSLATLRRLRAAGIPTVSVFLSGRPLWANPQINASDAFVAAWLPGTEGGGVADMLFGKADFRGKLSYSWPRRPDQTALNIGDAGYDPLFAYGYGLTLKDKGDLAPLPETRTVGSQGDSGTLFAAGRFGGDRTLSIGRAGALGANPDPNLITARRIDRAAQEDALRITWSGTGPGVAAITQQAPSDLTRQTNGQLALELDLRVFAAPTGPVMLGMACGDTCGGAIHIEDALVDAARSGGWVHLAIPLQCFATAGADMAKITAPLTVATSSVLDLGLSGATIASSAAPRLTCGAG